MFIVTAQAGRYAVGSDDERHGWVVIDRESQEAVFPDRVYGTAIAACSAAINRAAQETNSGPTVAPDPRGAR
jgi:hypothetical protein